MSGLILLPGINMKSLAISDLNLKMDGSFKQISTESGGSDSNVAPVKNITFVAVEKNLTLPSGQHINALTWNGTIPAPLVRVTQGDLLTITIINPTNTTVINNTLIHSMDHHASTLSAVPNFGPIQPGENKTYSFVATQPGFFYFHCEGNAVLTMDQHAFQGMVGGVIVDPADGYTGYETVGVENATNALVPIEVSPEAKEVALIFGEYYLNEAGDYDIEAMFNHDATATWFNGIPFGYDPVITKTPNATTLFFKQGDHVRFFALNDGNLPIWFHIVGEIFDRVTDGGIVTGEGKQTYNIGGANDAIIDVTFDKPGVYAMVNHDYSSLFKGQAGLIVVDGPDNATSKALNLTSDDNPSNAIPPTGADSIPVNVKPYMLGTPLAWDGQQ
jgi:nitrite reductase (NO-forming)